MNSIIHQNFFQKNKDLIIILATVTLSLVLFVIFPTVGIVQDLTKSIFFLVLMPYLFIRLILKERITDYGLNLEEKGFSFLWSVLVLIFNLGIFYFLVRFTKFGANYALPSESVSSFGYFLLYELIFVNLTIFVQEYFFRGFVLFSFRKFIGPLAIAVQFLFYIAFLLFTGSLVWQMLPFIILTISGGIISFKNKSFLHSYFIGILSIIILDAYLISQFK